MFYNIYTYKRGYKCTATNEKASNNEVKDDKKYTTQLNKTSKFTTVSNQHLQQSQNVKYSNEPLNEQSNSSSNQPSSVVSQEKSGQEKSNNNGSSKKSSDSTKQMQKFKKKSDLSESRERFNNIRYFYADPEIDKATEKPLVRLNPMTMFYMGVSDDNSHLLQSANCNFLHL